MRPVYPHPYIPATFRECDSRQAMQPRNLRQVKSVAMTEPLHTPEKENEVDFTCSFRGENAGGENLLNRTELRLRLASLLSRRSLDSRRSALASIRSSRDSRRSARMSCLSGLLRHPMFRPDKSCPCSECAPNLADPPVTLAHVV